VEERSNNVLSSTVAASQLTGERTKCPKRSIIVLSIPMAMFAVLALAIIIYALIHSTAARTTSISTGTAAKRRCFYLLNSEGTFF
jgi:amino acid transporter